MTIFDRQFWSRSLLLQVFAATLLVALATSLTSALWLLVDRPISAPLFLAAIVVATWLGGLRLGIYTSFLAGVSIDFFFVQPFHVMTASRDEIVRLLVFLAEGSFLSLLVQKWRAATDELRTSREELRALTRHQQTVREAEQKRIALEIHDELGQALTGLKLDMHLIRRDVESSGPSEKVIDRIDGLSHQVDQTIESVRRIASEIRPSILDDFGLIAALEWQSAEFERKSGVECTFNTNSDSTLFDTDTDSAVFRIFQEALTNISRHAEASNVMITLDRRPEDVLLRIEDNGRGIDPENAARSKSLGLLGMRERARLIGANIDVQPAPTGGTLVELVVPLQMV